MVEQFLQGGLLNPQTRITGELFRIRDMQIKA